MEMRLDDKSLISRMSMPSKVTRDNRYVKFSRPMKQVLKGQAPCTSQEFGLVVIPQPPPLRFSILRFYLVESTQKDRQLLTALTEEKQSILMPKQS